MARAGYDPAAMADVFARLREETERNPSALQTSFSGHPRLPTARTAVRRVSVEAHAGAPRP